MRAFLVLFLIVFAADGAYYEGDICSKDGVLGVCTKIHKCPSANEDIIYRRVQNCGFIGLDPIICCVKALPTTTTTGIPVLTTTIRPSTTTKRSPPVIEYIDLYENSPDGCSHLTPSMVSITGRKARDKCLEYQEKLVYPCERSMALMAGLIRGDVCHHKDSLNKPMVVGGGNAALNEFPHMALLGYGDDVFDLAWLCSGSLISENFILTAGHCTHRALNGPVTYAVLGTMRRSGGGKRFKVKEIIKHPEYSPPRKYHDIALLKLREEVILSEFVVPACLHRYGDTIEDSPAAATGWGYTKYRRTDSDLMQKVVLTKFNTSECANKFPPYHPMTNGFDEETQICYGDKSGSNDTCQADTGGPLQVQNKEIKCMYTIVGVTSFAKACGFTGEPGIYTRVAHYVDWIEKIVWA